ncbi:MAG: CotH kinase family protein [Eubacteriales bacterium]
MKRSCISVLSAILLTFSLLFTNLPLSVLAEDTESASASDTTPEPLPTVEIFTDSGEAVTQKIYESATLKLNLTDRFADYTNLYTESGGTIEIRCRGNSTYDTSPNRLGDSGKFSYKIKLESKTDLLGLGENRHFALIANYYDVTNLRNKLVYDLADRMGLTSTASRWVVVYLNGEYQGLYTLCETVRIGKNRVDIPDFEEFAEDVADTIGMEENLSAAETEELEEQMKANLNWISTGRFGDYILTDYGIDVSSVDLTSGYLIELDYRMDGDTTKFYTGMGIPIQLDSPKALETNPEMLSYVKNLLADFEEAISSPTFTTQDGRHYSEFVDMDSLVDYFLIFHLFKNIEFGFLSIYFYIDDGKIVFGPCWDFDGSSGNQVTLTVDWMPYNSWFYMNRGPWFLKLCSDPYFVNLLEERWFEIRDLVDGMMEEMELAHDYIREEAEKNFAFFGAPQNWYIPGSSCRSFEDEYQILKSWMEDRIAWLNEMFSLRNPNLEGLGADESDRISLTLTEGAIRKLAIDQQGTVGAPCDFLLTQKQLANLTLTIDTAHTSHVAMEVYVNEHFVARVDCNQYTPAKLTLPAEVFDLTEGKVQIVRVVGINTAGDYYRSAYLRVRYTELGNPGSTKALLTVDGVRSMEEIGTVVTLPEITVERTGYRAVGWTDGTNVYDAGSEITVTAATDLYIKWAVEDLFYDRTPVRVELPVSPVSPVPPAMTTPGDDFVSEPPKGTNRTALLVAVIAGVAIVGAGVVTGLLVRKRKIK